MVCDHCEMDVKLVDPDGARERTSRFAKLPERIRPVALVG